MSGLDVFNNDAFGMVSLTKGVNIMPRTYGLIGALGIFSSVMHATRAFAVEEDHGVLNLVPQTPTGSAGTRNKTGKRKARYFEIGRRRLEDSIRADDIQNLRGYNGDQELAKVSEVIARRQISMKRKHDQTREFLRMGALNGLVLDADGSTILDLYSEFGVTKKVIPMDLTNASSNVVGHALDAKTHIDDNLTSSMSTGTVALCSTGFFRALILNAKIEKIFENYTASGAVNNNPLMKDVRNGFEWQGVTWIEYNGKATSYNEDGTTTTRKFIPDDEAIMLPVGTTDVFEENFAPADHIGYANMEAQEFYSWMEEAKGCMELTTETDVLPMVKNPRVLVSLKKGAA